MQPGGEDPRPQGKNGFGTTSSPRRCFPETQGKDPTGAAQRPKQYHSLGENTRPGGAVTRSAHTRATKPKVIPPRRNLVCGLSRDSPRYHTAPARRRRGTGLRLWHWPVSPGGSERGRTAGAWEAVRRCDWVPGACSVHPEAIVVSRCVSVRRVLLTSERCTCVVADASMSGSVEAWCRLAGKRGVGSAWKPVAPAQPGTGSVLSARV